MDNFIKKFFFSFLVPFSSMSTKRVECGWNLSDYKKKRKKHFHFAQNAKIAYEWKCRLCCAERDVEIYPFDGWCTFPPMYCIICNQLFFVFACVRIEAYMVHMYTDCVCILYIDRRTRHCEWNDECGYGKAFLLHHFVIDVNKNKMICNATCTYISSQNGFMALGNRHFSKHFISTRVQRTHIFNQIHIYNLCANTYPWNLLHIRNSENTLWHFVRYSSTRV